MEDLRRDDRHRPRRFTGQPGLRLAPLGERLRLRWQTWQGRLGGLMAGEGADRRARRAAVQYLGSRRTPEVC